MDEFSKQRNIVEVPQEKLSTIQQDNSSILAFNAKIMGKPIRKTLVLSKENLEFQHLRYVFFTEPNTETVDTIFQQNLYEVPKEKCLDFRFSGNFSNNPSKQALIQCPNKGFKKS